MSDVLAIFEAPEDDERLLAELVGHRPERVWLLLANVDPALVGQSSPAGELLRERLAVLLAAAEQSTGATVIGLAGDRHQLRDHCFDHELSARLPLAA